MSRYLYKQYIRIIAKWPRDQFKDPNRDLPQFLTKDAEQQLGKNATQPIDAALCDRRLKALEEILQNKVHSSYPHSYKSGVFGLNLQQLQEASREENRKHFGLTARENLVKRAWRFVFQPQNAAR